MKHLNFYVEDTLSFIIQNCVSLAQMFTYNKNFLVFVLLWTRVLKIRESPIIRNIGNNRSTIIRFWFSSQRAIASEKLVPRQARLTTTVPF